MERPNKQNFCTSKFIRYDSKQHAKALDEYVNYLHAEINAAFEFLDNAGINLSDNGDQCYQILQKLTKQAN